MSEIITQAPSYFLTQRRRKKEDAKKAAEAAHDKKLREQFAMAPSMEDVEYADKDLKLAEKIGIELVAAFPGHGWQVESDIRNGIVKIYNCHVSGKYGWVMKIRSIVLATLTRDVRRIGAEMLERSGLKVGAAVSDDIMAMQVIKESKRVDLT